jgi:hypothetical protein
MKGRIVGLILSMWWALFFCVSYLVKKYKSRSGAVKGTG